MDLHDPEWERLESLLNAEANSQSWTETFRVIPSQENDVLEVKCGKVRKSMSAEEVSNLLQSSIERSQFVRECRQSNSSRAQEA